MVSRISTAVSIVLALQSGIVLAGSTLQGSADFSYDTTKYSNNDKQNNIGMNFEYYLEPVEKKSHPWREASFLEHTPSVNVEIDKETDEPGGSAKYDGFGYSLGGTYASKSNPLVGMLIYNNSSLSADFPPNSADRKTSLLGVGAGAFVNKSLAIVALYVDSEVKTTYKVSPPPDSKVSVTGYSLLSKYVYELPKEQAFNLEFQYVSYDFKPEGQPSQSDNSVDLKGVYYINPKVGIGGEIAKQNGDSNFFKGTIYGLGVDAFVNENISLTAQYTGFSADNSAGSDSDEWKISAAWWF